MSISSFRMENNTHQCQQCGMKFYNSHQLVNHAKKFCTAAGLNSLQGLAQYQHSSNFSKKLKNYGAHSLGSMKYQPVYNASQLAKQAKGVELHRQQLAMNRPYSNTNSQLNNYKQDYGKKNQTDLGVYQRSIVRKVDIPQNINPRAAFGQRILADSEVSIKSLENFPKQQKPINQKHPTQANIDHDYYSPPSSLPLPSPFTKQVGPSMLDKSISSIAKMSLSQKRDYATDKLVQLDNIATLYDKSGGMSMDFRKNLQKMRKFYQKMLQDQRKMADYVGDIQQSRAQTPISRLRQLDNDQQNKIKRDKKKQPQDIIDKELASKLSGKKSKNQNQLQKKSKFNIDSSQNYPFINPSQHFPLNYSPQFYPQQYNPYQQHQPQIIMMPPYPQQPQQQNTQITEQIKYFQKMIEVKNEENKKLMQMLLQTKRQKNQTQLKQNIQKVRQSRISEIRSGNYQNNVYHMQTPMGVLPSSEQRILLALQRQQLDQLRLLSSLPPQLQQIKMQSVMKIIEQRTQLQKQILQQKVRRLQQQQMNQLHLQQTKLNKDQWANQQRKKLIGHQMDSIIGQLKKKVNGQGSQDDQQEQQDQNDQQNGDGQ